ncbi:MAG: hypothetical protein QOF60_2260, partial [Actinomycetota bacterium]|nr:hypothetical protein [Actinomycetota bacterium]
MGFDTSPRKDPFTMAPNPPRSRWALFAAGALGSALLGTAGIAAAQSTTATPEAAEATRPEHAGHANETALTGDTADKVTAAALAAVPGATVDRVETDADGSPYEAHLTKADGSHVTVKVDANFAVT